MTLEKWTISKAQSLFSESETNEDMAFVEHENKIGWHWVRRYQQLIERGCPKVIAYDTIAVRARRSRRWVQMRVRAYEYFEAGEIEEFSPVGITFLDASLTRENPQAFLSEAIKHPNVVLETLLQEFTPAPPIVEEVRELPPYPTYCWQIGRRLASLPISDKAEVESAMNKIVEIFKKNGIE